MMTGLTSPEAQVPIERVETAVYTVPTDLPESDGTYTWNSTTMVLVEVSGGGMTGIGYTYADAATAKLIQSKLADVVTGEDALSVRACWELMVEAIRNLGRPGICSMAISAVDIAIWDLKAKLLGLPLARLLGQLRDGVPVYGSGGFTSYTLEQLADQLGDWVDAGIPRVKMKVGRDSNFDVIRVRTARERIGPETELFIDANGAYDPRTALFQAERLSAYDVSWFEEPVSSDNLPGLRFMRQHAPVRMDIAAGEYGYDLGYFRRMLAARALDVQQADATRCTGVTGFLQAANLCQAFMTPLSAHCGPTAHLAVCCAAPMLRHLEYFHDHVRIERIFFDGFREPVDGVLYPDLSRPGLGVELKRSDAEQYCVG